MTRPAPDAAAAMCDSGTMALVEFGPRIGMARDDARMTQAELAQAVDLDRTAIVRIEAGTRKVSAAELLRISIALDRPINWFVEEGPPAVVSRRREASNAGSRVMDLQVERLARDVDFLLREGVLGAIPKRPEAARLIDLVSAESLAAQARDLVDVPTGPVFDVQRAVERVGLLAFCLPLGEAGGDTAYVEVGDLGRVS